MPASNSNVPAPVKAPLGLKVPPPNSSVAPEPAAQEPLQVVQLLSPPVKSSVVVFAATLPELLNTIPIVVVAVPPVFSNVPALLKATAAPPPNCIKLSFV